MRQLASVMLKQYVESGWTKGDNPEPLNIVATVLAQMAIKSILPKGLYDPNSKNRSVFAYTISTIASYDWPNYWGDLFKIIVKCLSDNENPVHGAMQVLVEITNDLNTKIGYCGPLNFSGVYRIFEADQL